MEFAFSFTGLFVRHRDLSHEMLLSHKGSRTMSHFLSAKIDLLRLKLALKKF